MSIDASFPRNHQAMTIRSVLLVLLVASLLAIPTAGEASEPYDAEIDLTFPMRGEYSFMDDYDHWRGGGTRRHRATDIMAATGEPIYAAMGGTVSYITGLDGNPPNWGYAIYIAGDDGRTYVYIHLGRQDGPPSEAYAPGVKDGSQVARGQHIGFNGHSGNASASAPHLHLEIHDDRVTDPYGSSRMNPYRSLVAAEQRGDIGGGANTETAEVTKPYAISGDWDGSGRDGVGWWHDGEVVLRTADGEELRYTFGQAGDVPIVADWNGDGHDTVSIVRDRTWHIREYPTDGPPDRSFIYGRVSQGDVPISGDWDGSGTDGIGIIRDGDWHLRNDQQSGPGTTVFRYGRILQGDRALIGAWNGDGSDRIGIVRDREWHLRHSLTAGPADRTYIYGRVATSDVPVMGDWNGDGRQTPGIARGDEWHLRHEHAGGHADETFTFGSP